MGSNKTKVLIIMHGAGKGGVEASIANLCMYFDKENFEPIVAMPCDGPFKAYVEGMGVKTIITPLEWWTPIWFFYGYRHYYNFLAGLRERVANLVKIINENGISLVHSSTLTVADGAIAAKLSARPHIWHLHGRFNGTPSSSFGTYIPIDTLYALVGQLSVKVVAVSQIVKDFVSGYVDPSKVHVIYNGIDMDKYNDGVLANGNLVKDYPTLKNKVRVALVGRIAEVKGIENYVEAAIDVIRHRDDVSFLIVGPEEDKTLGEKVKKRVNSLGLADKIIFTGYRDDIPSLLREIDLVVCSSRREGFSYSCLEAMAASKPVVTTKCGGPEEIVVHGETGYVVEMDRPKELSEAITSLIENQDKLKIMGIKGRQRCEELFHGRICARNFESLYLEVIRHEQSRDIWTGPWCDLFVHLTANLGMLGSKVIDQEREIRDLKNFEAQIKKNVFYRSLRKCIRFFNHKKGESHITR